MATPTPVFPSAVATSADLKVAGNLVQSVLSLAVTATDTIITIRDASRFRTNMLLSIDQEILSATAVNGNLVTVQRGFDGTSAAPHAANALVSVFIDAWHHNRASAEIMAIESFLGPNGSNLAPSISSGSYIFTPQSPGGNLIAGSNVITLSPVPLGVNGTDIGHWLYISGGTGTAESALITGGTAAAGAASGTLIITCANAHSGAWTIQTATSGIQEAIVALAGPGQVLIPAGRWPIHAPVTIPASVLSVWQGYAIVGMGRLVSTLLIAADFSLSHAAVFIPLFNPAITFSGPGPQWSNFGVVFPQNYSLPLSGMTHWPPVIRAVDIVMGNVTHLYVTGAWQAFVLTGSAITIGQWLFEDINISGYGPGVFQIDNASDSMRFSKVHLWPFQNGNLPAGGAHAIYNPEVIALVIGQAASVMISDCYFLCGTAMKFFGLGGSSAITVVNTGFDVFGVIDMSRVAGGIQINFTNCVFIQVPSQDGFTAPSAMFVYGSSAPELTVSNCSIYRGSPTQPLASIVGPNGANAQFSQVSFTGNLIYESSNVATAAPLFEISNTPGNPLVVKISGNQISYANNLTYTNPMLRLTGVGTTVVFQNNNNAGYGSGTWLSIANDDRHFISGNLFNGPIGSWVASLPANKLLGYYQDAAFQYGPPGAVINMTGPVITGISGSSVSYICNAAAGAVQLNLPFAAASKGQILRLKKTDASANLVSFVPAGAERIEGVNAPRNTATQYAILTVISNGVEWWLL